MENKECERRWRLKNKEKIKEKSRKYYLEHREKFLERSKNRKDYKRTYYLKNKSRILNYHKKNKDKINTRRREISKNPIFKEKTKVRNYAYHSLRAIIIYKRKYCENCKSINNLEIHHINYLEEPSENNLKLLCRDCHFKEHRTTRNEQNNL